VKQYITIPEADWSTSIYRTKEWEQSVRIIRWEHDYVEGVYKIEYEV